MRTRWLLSCWIIFCVSASVHGQNTWVRKLTGSGFSIEFNPHNPQTAFAGMSGRLMYVSRDAGEHWDTLWTFPSSVFTIVVHPADTSMIFAGTNTQGLWRSPDGGLSWSRVLDGVGFIGESVVIDPSSPEVMYAGSSLGGLYRSTTYGSSWELVAGTDTVEYCTVVVRPDSTNILYAGSVPGIIWKSTNHGTTWRPVLVSQEQAEVPIIVIDPQHPLNAYAAHYGTPKGISKTTDGGDTWQASGLDGINTWSLDIDPNNTSVVLAGEYDPPNLGRMFRSTNGGQTWDDISNGLPQGTIIAHWSLKIVSMETPLVLAAVGGSQGGGGIYKLEKVPVTVVEGNNEIPKEFTLEQNYPNPFNPTTTIRFQIPREVRSQRSEVSLITLKVYNILGREVATLMNEEMRPGSYEVTWDAAGMASGVYLYRFQAGSFVGTKKLMLLR